MDRSAQILHKNLVKLDLREARAAKGPYRRKLEEETLWVSFLARLLLG